MKDPVIEERARRAVCRAAGAGFGAAPVRRLAGHASMRSYWRVGTYDPAGGGARPASYVVMVMPPDARPEEVTNGERPAVDPFLDVQRYLSGLGVRVPGIAAFYQDDPRGGLMVLEDLGDEMLETRLLAGDDRRSLYEAAIDQLARLRAAAERAPGGSIAFTRSFDRDLYRWELDHFREWLLEAWKGARLSPSERELVDREFERIAATLEAEPKGFTHRDYQSRNLMVLPGGAQAVIDFQDALLGPRQYDLVALLHGEEVEDGAERRVLEARPARLVEAVQVAPQHGVHEPGLELDVAVAQERHEVVLPRPEERVLEVDHRLLAGGEHHEVARLVVAVGEPLGLGLERPGDGLELAIHHRALRGRQARLLPGLEQPLAEVVQLPEVQVVVEGAAEGDAPAGARLGVGAEPGEGVDRPLVERPRRIAGEEPRLEHVVPEVLEDHEPTPRVVLVERVHPRDAHADRGEVALDVEEGVDAGGAALRDLLRLGVRRHHHHHPGGGRPADAPVAPHRGMAGEAHDRLGGGLPPGGAGDGAAHASFGLGVLRHLVPLEAPGRAAAFVDGASSGCL